MTTKGVVRGAVTFLCLTILGVAWAQPFSGPRDGEFTIHVLDVDVDQTAYEMVTQDTGFTPMSTDTTISVYFDTTGGGGNVDTAIVHIMGVRQNTGGSALKWQVATVKVGGGDTTVSTEKFHAYQGAYLDTAMAGSVLIWSTGASPRGSKVDSIAIGSIWQPRAHVFFGKDDRGFISAASARFINNATCELRGYTNLSGTVGYGSKYVVLVSTDSTRSGGYYSTDWNGEGYYLGSNSYAGWFCQGASANADVAVTISGRRK